MTATIHRRTFGPETGQYDVLFHRNNGNEFVFALRGFTTREEAEQGYADFCKRMTPRRKARKEN